MTVYWLLFLLPAMASYIDRRLGMPVSHWHQLAQARSVWLVTAMAVALTVGLRYEVGGDWFNYLRNLNDLRGVPLLEALAKDDPGYHFFSWLSLRMGWSVLGVNLLSAAIFAGGLIAFCRAMPQPWLALAVAMPYLVIVVAMGYTRQSVALGFAMIGLIALQRHRLPLFLISVVLGATFHKSAVLLLPIPALAATRNRYWSALWVALITFVAYQLLLEDSVDGLVNNYIDSKYQSEGALIRLTMNAVPAVLMLKWRHNFFPDRTERSLWSWLAVISLVLFGIYYLTPASTAVDRVALYILPLQLVVFSRLPVVLGGASSGVRQWTLIVLLYYALVLFVWTNFAAHATYWIPYRLYLWELLFGDIRPLE